VTNSQSGSSRCHILVVTIIAIVAITIIHHHRGEGCTTVIRSSTTITTPEHARDMSALNSHGAVFGLKPPNKEYRARLPDADLVSSVGSNRTFPLGGAKGVSRHLVTDVIIHLGQIGVKIKSFKPQHQPQPWAVCIELRSS